MSAAHADTKAPNADTAEPTPGDAAPEEIASEEASPSAPGDATPLEAAQTPLAPSGGEGLMHEHDVAARLGLTVKELREKVRAGLVPVALRIKGRPRFRISDINRVIAEGAVAAAETGGLAGRGDYEWCSE